MQVACGSTNRLIRYEVLDRDMFEENPKTPEQTSKTLELLSRINAVLGKNILDRPIFSTGEESSESLPPPSPELADLGNGKFDALFADAPDKPSLLYAEAQKPHHPPNIILAESTPVAPKEPKLPSYPPIAKAAHVDGDVRLSLNVAPDGTASDVSALNGPPMLKKGAIDAAKQWEFPKQAQSSLVTATISYRMNCSDTKPH